MLMQAPQRHRWYFSTINLCPLLELNTGERKQALQQRNYCRRRKPGRCTDVSVAKRKQMNCAVEKKMTGILSPTRFRYGEELTASAQGRVAEGRDETVCSLEEKVGEAARYPLCGIPVTLGGSRWGG